MRHFSPAALRILTPAKTAMALALLLSASAAAPANAAGPCDAVTEPAKLRACQCVAATGGKVVQRGRQTTWVAVNREAAMKCLREQMFPIGARYEGHAACALSGNAVSRGACNCSVDNGGYATYLPQGQVTWKEMPTAAYAQCVREVQLGRRQ